MSAKILKSPKQGRIDYNSDGRIYIVEGPHMAAYEDPKEPRPSDLVVLMRKCRLALNEDVALSPTISWKMTEGLDYFAWFWDEKALNWFAWMHLCYASAPHTVTLTDYRMSIELPTTKRHWWNR